MTDRTISLYDYARMSGEERARLLVRSEADLADFIVKVQPIIDRVRAEGDAALAHFAQAFDKADLQADSIQATPDDFGRAFDVVESDVIESIEYAAHGIREFHRRQKPEEMWMHEVRPGVFAGEKCEPIPSVALYVPRGKGAFPSVALMTAIPAVVAEVPEIALITPPRPDGGVDAATLVAARIAGISNVYKCGGAQGVAAVAYGTQTVPKCAKIVGPGSPWVVAAKRVLAGVIDPGLPAGPSESIILADETADGALAALDLIVESEHGPDSSAFLVTNSRTVAEAARDALPGYWAQMGAQRVEFSSSVLCGPRGGIVLTETIQDAIDFVNAYAPEHLEILGDEPIAYLGRIKNAGEILLGANTPIPLGNFVLGPNAVLPTSGSARTCSPLSVFDYMKRISIGQVTAAAYPEMARHAERLARYEGFDGHANAVSATRTRVMAGKA